MSKPPAPASAAEPDDAQDEARQRALQRLMKRMRAHPDMPSLGESISSIQRIVNSEHSHMSALTGGVLSDVALTAKLLRLINTATYRSSGDGSITSVQRALALMGFRAVGMLAASLLLFDRLPKGSEGLRVREAYSQALLAGLLAEELCTSVQDVRNSYLTGVYMNLGEMLVSLHFPDEARTIEEMLRTSHAVDGLQPGEQAHDLRMQVSRSVLGLSIQDLGSEVASQWGWPTELRGHLRRLYPSNNRVAAPGQEYLRILATGASDLSLELHLLRATRDLDAMQQARGACVDRFAGTMGVALAVGGQPLQEAVERAIMQWTDLAGMLGLDDAAGRQRNRPKAVSGNEAKPPLPALPSAAPVRAGAPSPAVQQPAAHGGGGAAAAPAAVAASPQDPTRRAPLSPLPPPQPPQPQPPPLTEPQPQRPRDGAAPSPSPASEEVAAPPRPPRDAPTAPPAPRSPAEGEFPESEARLEALSLALARASERALSGASIDELVARILEDLSHALHLQNVALCLREPSGRLRARHAIGPGAREILKHFEVPLGASTDLFSVLCAHGRVTLISDATKPAMAARLPAWFKIHVKAPCFVLLPMAIDSRVVGLMYADVPARDSLQLGERALAMLGTLRNQLLLALRLRGIG